MKGQAFYHKLGFSHPTMQQDQLLKQWRVMQASECVCLQYMLLIPYGVCVEASPKSILECYFLVAALKLKPLMDALRPSTAKG